MSDPTTKPIEFKLIVDPPDDGFSRYWRIRCRVIGGEYDGPCQDLELVCHATPGESPFWMRPEYRDALSVDLSRAQTMVKVLSKIQRHAEKHAERFGPAVTFGQVAARAADALGIRSWAFRSKRDPSETITLDTPSAVYRLDRDIEDLSAAAVQEGVA